MFCISSITKIIIEIKVPKFMDTSSLNVDLHPDYVRCEIKESIFFILIFLNLEENVLFKKVHKSSSFSLLKKQI